MKGPVGEIDYWSKGNFTIDGEPHFATTFNMVCGGTGITPVAQVAAEILRNADDKTKINLIFGCRGVDDILLRDTLDNWAAEYPEKFTCEVRDSDEQRK